MFYQFSRRRVGTLFAICISLLLSGCFEQQQTITVHDDGRAEMALLLTFPKEMEVVRDAIAARAALDPRLAMLDGGFCEALNAIAPEGVDVRIKAREITSTETFTCRVDVAMNDFPKTLETNGAIAALGGLAKTDDRTYRYEMQTMPLALGEMAWRGLVAQNFKEQGVSVTNEQLSAIVASDKAGLMALTQMVFRGATSTFTIRAPEIVETNGIMSDDRTRVTFKTTLSDMVGMALDPDAAEAPFIVFRY